MKLKIIYLLIFVIYFISNIESKVLEVKPKNSETELIEQGRTLVHNTVKRFMILLPAIFFKLGIAFTLLILVALAAVNNGVIGFLILVVGLSSVLARLQDPGKTAVTIPYIQHTPVPSHYHQIWDRSDNLNKKNHETEALFSNGLDRQNYDFGTNPQLTSYYSKYSNGKK